MKTQPESIIPQVARMAFSGCDLRVPADFFYVWVIMVSNSLTNWKLGFEEKVTSY